MKKKYMMPQMEVIRISTGLQLLAGSIQSASLEGLGDNNIQYDDNGGAVDDAW